MKTFVWLQETSIARWVSESTSLLAYPTILVFHTIGFSLVVGASFVISLRLLGYGKLVPLTSFQKLFGLMWAGFAVNTITGILLFAADAVHKSTQWIFLVKLIFVAGGLIALTSTRRFMTIEGATVSESSAARGRFLAVASIILWAGATISGRLMAYIK